MRLDRREDLELAHDLLLGVRSKDGELSVSSPCVCVSAVCQRISGRGSFLPAVRRGDNKFTTSYDSAISLTKLMPSPCRGEVSAEVRGEDTPTNLTDFKGDSLTQDDELLSLRLQMESSVALGDPCGVAAVWVMMGAAADGCNKC